MHRTRFVLIALAAVLAAATALTAALRMTWHGASAEPSAQAAAVDVTIEDGPVPRPAPSTAAPSAPAPAPPAEPPPSAVEPAAAVSMYLDNPHAPSLPAEMTALGAARYHVRAGDFEHALEQLERMAELFPQGALRSERTVEFAVVHCALGQFREGRGALQALRGATPPVARELIDRAERACER